MCSGKQTCSGFNSTSPSMQVMGQSPDLQTRTEPAGQNGGVCLSQTLTLFLFGLVGIVAGPNYCLLMLAVGGG